MKKISCLFAVLTAIVVAVTPCLAFAAPDVSSDVSASKPTANMVKSEKAIKDLFKLTDAEKIQKQFYSIVKPRLRYATVRSLTGRSDKWLAFVDVYQLYKAGKPDGYKIQQATLQYGVHGLPPYSISCTLNIGSFSSTIEKSARSVYIFNYSTLNSDAEKGNVSIEILEFSSNPVIKLNENLPGKVINAEGAIKSMSEAYIAHCKALSPDANPIVKPIDAATLKLRSHVVDTLAMEMNYTWELVLIHDGVFPADATIIRYNVQTGKATVSTRAVNSY